MPIYLRMSGYKIYFWSNEAGEPVHFHVSRGKPNKSDTKIWLLSNGSFMLAHNRGKISKKDLARIFTVMQNYYFDFIDFWKTYRKTEEIKFYR